MNCRTLLVYAENSSLREMHLLRIPSDERFFELVLLFWTPHGPAVPTAFVFTEIAGRKVDVKRAVVGYSGYLRFDFLRVDVDAARVESFEQAHNDDGRFSAAQMSEDGRELHAIDFWDRTLLHVYSLDTHAWSRVLLDGAALSGKVGVVSFNT